MKEAKRALRRHHLQRIKAKTLAQAKIIWPHDSADDYRRYVIATANPARAGCAVILADNVRERFRG